MWAMCYYSLYKKTGEGQHVKPIFIGECFISE